MVILEQLQSTLSPKNIFGQSFYLQYLYIATQGIKNCKAVILAKGINTWSMESMTIGCPPNWMSLSRDFWAIAVEDLFSMEGSPEASNSNFQY